MPLYYFNVYDGREYRDSEGSELPDAHAAQVEAIDVAGQFIRDMSKRFALGEDWRMEVTDAQGLILFRLDFHVTAAPVMTPHALPAE